MRFIEAGNALICALPKRLDTQNSQELEVEINNWIDTAHSKVVFDFQDVEFISSYFLRICLATHKKVGNENFEITNVRADIKKVFMIAGFDKFITIISTD